jgi:hypothetical protein
MDHAIVAGIVNALPIEKMVSAPLTAAIKAQSDMSLMLAQFVNNVGLDKEGNVRMVTFSYEDTTIEAPKDGGSSTTTTASTKRSIQAPFIALTGIPNLAIEDVNISFELEVSTAEDQKDSLNTEETASGSFDSWWSPWHGSFSAKVTSTSEHTRHTDTRAKYSFNVSARKQPSPEAFMRIVDAITNNVANPVDSSKKQLPKNLTPEDEAKKDGGGTKS